jgi:tyrosyl-tRNA synthetase
MILTMSKFKSDFMQIMEERGFLYQCTDDNGLDKLFNGDTPVSAYIGFDCTATSLHVGSLMQIMVLRWLQKTGNKPIVLIGGATTKVGDPSGKDETRKVLSEEDINKNIAGITSLFTQFGVDAETVNNNDWIKNLSWMELLRDYGRHISMSYMLGKDSVKTRLEREQHMSFLEFNYMLLQAIDFVILNKDKKCSVQIGGSDQWGNITTGIELQRKIAADNEVLFGLTTPLIATASGTKMGKTEKGAVWLSEDMLSSYDYWQFWRNTEDADVGKFLRLFTELPISEIEKLESLDGAEINEAKIVLANEATKLCHGEEAAKKAAETAKKTFDEGGTGDDLPVIEKNKSELEGGILFVELFLEAGLTSSKKEARRLIEGGGARKNGEKIEDVASTTSSTDIQNGAIKLSAGKKKHVIIKAA